MTTTQHFESTYTREITVPLTPREAALLARHFPLHMQPEGERMRILVQPEHFSDAMRAAKALHQPIGSRQLILLLQE